MKLATTTADFYGCRGNVPAQLVRLYASTGFRCLDYSFYNNPSPSLYQPGDGWKREIEDALAAAWELGITFVQAHAPDGEHFRPGEKREALLLAIRRSIEGCAMLKIPNLVVHAAQLPDSNATPRDFLKENIRFYGRYCRTQRGMASIFSLKTAANRTCPATTCAPAERCGNFCRRLAILCSTPVGTLVTPISEGWISTKAWWIWERSCTPCTFTTTAETATPTCSPLWATATLTKYSRDSKTLAILAVLHWSAAAVCGGGTTGPISGSVFPTRAGRWRRCWDPPEQLRQSYVRLMYETGRYMLEQYGLYEG